MTIDKTPATSKEIKSDRFNIIKNKDLVKELGEKHGNILNRTSLIKVLKELKETTNVSEILSLNKFVYYITDFFQFFEEVAITRSNGDVIIRYVSKYNAVSPYEIALSIYSNLFLSHYSALFTHDLTLNNPKTIFINREQSEKPVNKENAILTQRKVDYAFTKEMRRTNNTYRFKYKDNLYDVLALNGKNTNKLGIKKMKFLNFSKKIQVTDIERSLIDITVRPQYSGGVAETLEAFIRAKDIVDIDKLLIYLEKINYIYPYERSILFYMSRANYPESEIRKVQNFKTNRTLNDITFYLDYQIIGKTLDSKFNIYYPKELDNIDIENTVN